MDRVVLSKRPVVIYHGALHMLCTNSRRCFLLFVDPPYTSTQVCYLLLFFRLGFSTASGFATSSLPNSVATPPSSTNFRFLSAVCSSHFFLSKRVHVCEKIWYAFSFNWMEVQYWLCLNSDQALCKLRLLNFFKSFRAGFLLWEFIGVLCRDVPTAFQYCVVSSLTLRLSCLKFQTDCGITGTSTLPKVSWSMVSELRANLGRTFLNITAAVALLMATSVSLFSRTYQTKPTPGGLILANPACLLFWRLFEDGGGGTRSSVARTVSSALSGVRCMDASKEPSWSPFHSFSSVVSIGSNECGWSSKLCFALFFFFSLETKITTNHFCHKCSPCQPWLFHRQSCMEINLGWPPRVTVPLDRVGHATWPLRVQQRYLWLHQTGFE